MVGIELKTKISSSYIIGLANSTSITKSGNDLVTANTIDSAIKNPSYTYQTQFG